jgi:hypothetical protein
MRNLFSRFYYALVVAVVALIFGGWVGLSGTTFGDPNAMPAGPQGLTPVSTMANLVSQLPKTSTFTILAANPGVNVLVKTDQTLYFVVLGDQRPDNLTLSQQLIATGSTAALNTNLAPFKEANKQINLYRNQNDLSRFIDPSGYFFGRLALNLPLLILGLFWAGFLLAKARRFRTPLTDGVALANAANGLNRSRWARIHRDNNKVFMNVVMLPVSIALAVFLGGFIVQVNLGPKISPPANYTQTKDLNDLMTRLPAAAQILVTAGPSQLGEQNILALEPDGGIYFLNNWKTDTNAQAVLLDTDGNTLAGGQDLLTLQAANDQVNTYLTIQNAQAQTQFTNGYLYGFCAFWLALIGFFLLMGWSMSYPEQQIWKKNLDRVPRRGHVTYST